jgi:anaerobic carbon-monoxide dehydrogenase iron sulfur subunit
MQTVFVNSEHCIGCRQCEFACAVEHSQSKSPTLACWEEPAPKPRIHVEAGPWLNTSFPNKCRHCNPAPCQAVCPTAAITRDAELDLVLIAPNKCIACAMCAMVCPFDAVTFHELAGVVPARLVATKCDGCVDRVSRGDEPACAEACKVDALVFGELNDLVRAGRVHDSALALNAAATVAPAQPEAPPTIQAWRSWGEQATRVAEGVQHDHAPSH